MPSANKPLPANVDPYLWSEMASVGLNESTITPLRVFSVTPANNVLSCGFIKQIFRHIFVFVTHLRLVMLTNLWNELEFNVKCERHCQRAHSAVWHLTQIERVPCWINQVKMGFIYCQNQHFSLLLYSPTKRVPVVWYELSWVGLEPD